MSNVPVLNGNTIILYFTDKNTMQSFVSDFELAQYAVNSFEGSWLLSTPVTKALEQRIPGVIHGARCRAEDKKPKPPTGPKGGPDGTPPGGGTPGSTRQREFINTEAVAA